MTVEPVNTEILFNIKDLTVNQMVWLRDILGRTVDDHEDRKEVMEIYNEIYDALEPYNISRRFETDETLRVTKI